MIKFITKHGYEIYPQERVVKMPETTLDFQVLYFDLKDLVHDNADARKWDMMFLKCTNKILNTVEWEVSKNYWTFVVTNKE